MDLLFNKAINKINLKYDKICNIVSENNIFLPVSHL